MSPQMVELALKKQRLQLRSVALRDQWCAHAGALRPAFAAADQVGRGAGWLRRHPEAIAAFVIAFLLVRPGRAARWLRRGFIGWQAWRKARRWLASRTAHPLDGGRQ